MHWIERDGWVTHIDRKKFEQFASNCDDHFQNAHIFNVYIIHHQCRWTLLENSEKYNRTIKQRDKTKPVSVTFSNSKRSDL